MLPQWNGYHNCLRSRLRSCAIIRSMKTCSLCKEELLDENFSKKLGRLQARCRKCHSIYTRKNYVENRQYYIDKAKRRGDIKRHQHRLIMATQMMNGCMDCGNDNLVVLEFDHRPGEVKMFNVGQQAGVVSDEAFLAEIEKCDVVCANCHRIRTNIRGGGFWRSNFQSEEDWRDTCSHSSAD